MFTIFLSTNPTAHECSLAMMPTAIINSKSERTIGQTWALKRNNIFLSNSEGSFEAARCHVIFLPVVLPQESLRRFTGAR